MELIKDRDVFLTRMSFIVVISLVVSGCNVINQLRLRSANDHLVPKWPTNTTTVEVDASFDSEKYFVYASINGQRGFKFMVDTGAATTSLFDTDKVKSLKLEKGYELTKTGWGDEQGSTAYQTLAKSLSLSGVEFTDVNVGFLPISKSRYFIDQKEGVFDGILGYDILRHFSWFFDKRAQIISISKESYQESGTESSVPLDVFFTRLYAEAVLDFGDGMPVLQELIIDTGSRHYMKLGTAYIEAIDKKLPRASVTAADFGLSGRALHQRVTLPGVKIADISLSNIKTNIIKTDDDDEYLVLGNALLNQYVMVIDYPSETMYLMPHKEHAFRTRYNLIGLELRKLTDGNFIVRYVMPDMAAANADIKEGDIITQINNVKSSDLTQSEWLEASALPGNHRLCRAREDTQCVSIISKHIKGYSSL